MSDPSSAVPLELLPSAEIRLRGDDYRRLAESMPEGEGREALLRWAKRVAEIADQREVEEKSGIGPSQRLAGRRRKPPDPKSWELL
jgi:hypothetical protein